MNSSHSPLQNSKPKTMKIKPYVTITGVRLRGEAASSLSTLDIGYDPRVEADTKDETMCH